MSKSQNIIDYVKRSNQQSWNPLIEKGIEHVGISVIPLRYDEKQGRSPSILLKFEPGARYPYHNHPGGEEVYVISGDAIFEDVTLTTGDYLYTPPGYRHSATTKGGCVLLFIIPEEVEILE